MEGTSRRRASAIKRDTSLELDGDSIGLLNLKDQCSRTDRESQPGKKLQSKRLMFTTVLVVATVSVLVFLLVASGNPFLNQASENDFSKILGLVDAGDDADAVARSKQVAIDLHPQEHILREPGIVAHNWTITSGIRAPDGVRKEVYLINGLFPGPTIEARSGDILEISVENALRDEGLSIHWHGLFMKGANDMDGAIGFTQDPILAGSHFKYKFKLDSSQHGTFWYHAHSQVQRGDGLYGGLIVHKPQHKGDVEAEKYGYEREVLLMVGDWYHRRSEDVLDWYTSVRAFGNEPVPDSLVINHIGNFNCSKAVAARPIDCSQDRERENRIIFAEDLSPTRVRIINTGSMAGISFGTSNAKITPLQVDGGFEISGNPVDKVGILYPGERVDLLLRWDPQAKSLGSVFTVVLDSENFKYPNPALTPTQAFVALSSSQPDLQPPAKDMSTFDLQTAQPISEDPHISILPHIASNPIILYTKTLKLSKYGNHPKGFINHTSWSPQTPPLITQQRSTWDKNQFVPLFTIPRNQDSVWIDIVINNLDDGSHPFHLHGHSFYVLVSHKSSRGWGSFDGKEKVEFDLATVLRKDTVMVPRRGFVVIRVRFDNVGIWMLHCHILVHLGSGMAMGFEVAKG